MPLADQYVLDFKQRYGAEETHNIFTFEQGEASDPFALSDAFITTLVPLINAIQHEDIKNVSVRAYTLGATGALWDQDVTGAGALAGSDMLPLHDAINFTLKTGIRAVRPGSKRFSGIPEVEQAGGFITAPAYTTSLNTLRVALASPVSAEAGIDFYPTVIKRIKYEVPDSDPVRFAYRFPEVGDPLVYSRVSVVLLNTKISHQVSR